MYGFNGQYPGPLIHVDQDSTIFVNFENHTSWPTAIHWHGLRLDNAFDGVPHLTQDPVPPGGRFEYRLFFPDAGLYWYHPHHREEVQQDLGLYGNMLVEAPPDTWYAPVHREEILMLDDLLIADDGGLFPFGTERATHSLMGRFGNLMLVNGEPEYALELDRGEVVRFFLTNVSNTRTFNLSFGEPGTHRIKVVGSDLSKFERETWVDSVALAPAERYIVEVRYETAGEHAIENRVRPLEHTFGGYFSRVTRLGTVTVSDRDADPAGAPGYDELRENAPVVEDVARFRSHFDREPDYELLLTMEVTGLDPAIMQRMRADRVFFPAVEWADTMPMMNSVATPEEVRWIVREPATGPRGHGHRLALFDRGRGHDPDRERRRGPPRDAASLPHPRAAVPGAAPERRAGDEPRVQGHRAHRRGGDPGPPARDHEPREVDGPLPHRRAPRNRHALRLRGGSLFFWIPRQETDGARDGRCAGMTSELKPCRCHPNRQAPPSRSPRIAADGLEAARYIEAHAEERLTLQANSRGRRACHRRASSASSRPPSASRPRPGRTRSA